MEGIDSFILQVSDGFEGCEPAEEVEGKDGYGEVVVAGNENNPRG